MRLDFRGVVAAVSACLIMVVGTFWAYERGGGDFSVFHEAWRLVLQGRGMEIYRATPDRFLYAPGFAWLMAPLGALPRPWALAVWCLAKSLVLGACVHALGRRSSLWAAAGAVALLARPILIDFQYGQINLFILGTCVWAMLTHFGGARARPSIRFISWFALGIAAVTKIYPLALLGVPIGTLLNAKLVRTRNPKLNGTAADRGLAPSVSVLAPEIQGALLGIGLVLFLPVLSTGLTQALSLHGQWIEALRGRGLPMESHNQSFAAFLHHTFTATSTHVVALAQSRDYFIRALVIPESTVLVISVAWATVALLFTLGWMVRGARSGRELEWSAVLIALLIVPSHLVWKPYFVFGLPLAAVLLHRARGAPAWFGLAAVLVLINFTGVDVLGYETAGRVEAASVLLWAHLAMLVAGVALAYRETRSTP